MSEKCCVLRGIIMADLIAKLPLILVLGYFFDPGMNYNMFLNIQVDFFFLSFLFFFF